MKAHNLNIGDIAYFRTGKERHLEPVVIGSAPISIRGGKDTMYQVHEFGITYWGSRNASDFHSIPTGYDSYYLRNKFNAPDYLRENDYIEYAHFMSGSEIGKIVRIKDGFVKLYFVKCVSRASNSMQLFVGSQIICKLQGPKLTHFLLTR